MQHPLLLKVVLFANSACFKLSLLPGCSVGWLRQQVVAQLAATGVTLSTVSSLQYHHRSDCLCM
jgi:hypothetical protein